MRTIVFGLAAMMAALALEPAPANAQVYPWCAQYGGRGGGTNCYFATWQQCRAAVSGTGGYCYQNPFFGYGSGAPRGRRIYRPY